MVPKAIGSPPSAMLRAARVHHPGDDNEKDQEVDHSAGEDVGKVGNSAEKDQPSPWNRPACGKKSVFGLRVCVP